MCVKGCGVRECMDCGCSLARARLSVYLYNVRAREVRHFSLSLLSLPPPLLYLRYCFYDTMIPLAVSSYGTYSEYDMIMV